MAISKKNISYSYSAAVKLLEVIGKYGIQIVEAPLWDAESFAFSLIKNVPLVVRLETPLFKVAEIQHWPVTRDLKLANWIEGEAARKADGIIAISHSIAHMISMHHGLDETQISLCPLGIHEPDQVPLQASKKSGELKVLFVGRLEKRKGIDTLFKAIPTVIDNVPSARFDIVGSDTTTSDGGSYKQHLSAILDKKYHNNVRFVGYVNNNRLAEYYSGCDIFVAPSLYESFGLIYLEAMAWGKPVIGCKVGGVPEVVYEGKTGLLVDPDDEKGLESAIIRLLSDESLRTEMGKCGVELVKDEFSIKKMITSTYIIYNDVLDKNVSSQLNNNIFPVDSSL
jgi:glycosyltransferase involved in cell wall biosynthesis